MSTSVPLIVEEDVQIHFALPDHETALLAESKICWSKSGRLGVRFVSLSEESKSGLQGWLSTNGGSRREPVEPEALRVGAVEAITPVDDRHAGGIQKWSLERASQN